ncbi:MAG: peptidase M13 [Actinobacteria bacterium]|nr:peptidase M13 [Actinomycetota bacterium]
MATNNSGIAFEHFDRSVRPQDDLYRHVNGTWLRDFELPADKAVHGVFHELRDLSEKQVLAIIEADNGKIGNLYKSFMAADAIEALGIAPITGYLAQVDGITNLAEFIEVMAKLEAAGLGGIFGSGVVADAKDSTTNIMHMVQGAISLPDEEYYREAEHAEIRSAFAEHVTAMFKLIGIDANGQRILDLETKIASHHWDAVKDRDATLTYNKFSRAELETLMPGFDWALYLKAGEVPAKAFETVIVMEPSFFTGLAGLLQSESLEDWKLWLKWEVVSGAAPYLTQAIVNQNFKFYGTTLSGTPQLRERWKRGVAVTEGALGEEIGKEYVARHFPPAAKAAMAEIINYLTEAYRISITNLDWMSAETKVKAIEKLDKFTAKVGYPDKWRDYSALEISPDDLMGNILRVAKFERDYELAKIGVPVDRTEWHMPPQTVNAYYSPRSNEVVFPAGFLQWPYFDLNADAAVNYAGIGATIGHELGHGFDDQGSKYDGDGNLNDWWLDSDRVEFEKRTKQLIDQFDALHPSDTPEMTVNGALTVGENIGDLGGLAIAYQAYKLSLQGKEAPIIDGLTGDQRFFIAHAMGWREKMRPETRRVRITVDPHSPEEFRCNQIISNLDLFYEAFEVKEGDGMWLDRESRVSIW